jgi:hypothetical protein
LNEEKNLYCGRNSYYPIFIIMTVLFSFQIIINSLFLTFQKNHKKFNKFFAYNFYIAPFSFAIYIFIHYLIVDGCVGEDGMKLFLRAALIIFIVYPFEYVIDMMMIW